MLTAEKNDQLVDELASQLGPALGIPYSHPNTTVLIDKAMVEAASRALVARVIEQLATDQYRQGFIAGATVGATVEDARWAIQNDMNGARVLRDDARETGDEVLWRNVRYFVAEARMWSQIVRILIRQQREGQ